MGMFVYLTRITLTSPRILPTLISPMASTLDELMDITKLPCEKADPWYRRLRAQFDQAQ